MADPEQPKRRRQSLVLDELTDQLASTFRIIQDPEGAAERALEQAGVHSREEQRIVTMLADRRPLTHPDRFLDAHQLVMRALEVLDREGWRNPQLPRIGPLKPVAEYIVELVAKYIVRSYERDVVVQLRRLYTRREAQCAPRSPERGLLLRARVQNDRVAIDFKGASLGLPTFLAGGAAISSLASLGKQTGALSGAGLWLILPGVLLFLLFAGVSWVLLQGAAVAHRRSTLILLRPLQALYETVGNCGNPPRDDSLTFAIVAIVLTAVAWLVIPAAIALAFTLG